MPGARCAARRTVGTLPPGCRDIGEFFQAEHPPPCPGLVIVQSGGIFTRGIYPDADITAVYTLDFEMETGSISNGRIAGRVPKNMEFPDGMTIDAEGMLWIVLWGGGQVEIVVNDGAYSTSSPLWRSSIAISSANAHGLASKLLAFADAKEGILVGSPRKRKRRQWQLKHYTEKAS